MIVHAPSGKTYFLIYALLQFLGQKQPVAIQPLDGSPYYILFKDGVTFHPIEDGDPLDECVFVWALSDSNADIGQPPAVFRGDCRRMRVIQATPPEASRWKQWSKEMCASPYVMDVWSSKEIVNFA